MLLPALSAAFPSDEGFPGGRASNFVLSITPQNATQRLDTESGPASATFCFEVQNTGPSLLPALELELYPWTFSTDEWTYMFIPSLPAQLPPGDPPSTVLLVIYPAADAAAKRYTFQLKGIPGVDTNSISINLDILQHGGVRVIAPSAQGASPGETLEFDFEILNSGNGKDRFFISSVEAGVSSMTPVLKDGNNYTADVASGGSAFKTVAIAIPYDAKTTDGGDGYRLTLTARSVFNQSRYDSNRTGISIRHIYDLALGLSPPNASVLPGQMAEFTVTVVNLGNGYDNVSLGIGARFPSTGWSTGLEKGWLNLSAQGSAAVKLRISPPFDALRGNYLLQVTARSGGGVERSECLEMVVLPLNRIIVPRTNFTSPYPVRPGEPVQFPVEFRNAGNGEETLDLTVFEVPANWTATAEPGKGIRVSPGATRAAVVTVTPSPELNESIARPYFVMARLTNTDLCFIQELEFEIDISPVYDFDLWPEGSARTEVNLFVSGRQTMTFLLRNLGNSADGVALALGGQEASWGRLDQTVVPLARGELKALRLELLVPPSAVTVSTYSLTVTAASLGRPGLFVERTVFVTVRNYDPSELLPRLRVFPANKGLTLTEGTTFTLPVSVLCSGSDIGNVSLRITGGEGLDLSIEVVEPGRDLAVGENHTFYVKVRVGRPNGTVSRGTIEIQAVGQGVAGQVQVVRVTIQKAPRPALVVSMEGLGIALAIFLALGGIAVGWNEVVTVALLNLLLPLYVKLRHEEVLDQYTRGKIHGYIIANPGEHYNSIKAQLRLKNGTLAYHLRVLEREGFLKTTRDGMFKRFYPREALIPRRKSEFTAIQEIVLENIRSSPGINQNELARQMGVSSQVVNYHIHSLVAAGMIRLERDGRVTRCFMK